MAAEALGHGAQLSIATGWLVAVWTFLAVCPGCGGRDGSAAWGYMSPELPPLADASHGPAKPDVAGLVDTVDVNDATIANCQWTGSPEPAVLPDTACEVGPAVDGFVRICPGTFVMGGDPNHPYVKPSELPQRDVTITKPFWIQATEVTVGEFVGLVGKNPVPSKGKGCLQCPVVSVTMPDIATYLNALSRAQGLPECFEIRGCEGEIATGCPEDDWDGKCFGLSSCTAKFYGSECSGFRLPTEAEWEFAARAGSTLPLYGDPTSIGLLDVPNNSPIDPAPYPLVPVGSFTPNAWALYDTIGGAEERCLDAAFQLSYGTLPRRDPYCVGGLIGSTFRGGHWATQSVVATVSIRSGDSKGHFAKSKFSGFRAARNAEP